MNKLFYIFLAILIITSCSKDDPSLFQTDNNGVIISQSYLWKSSLHEDNVFHSNGYVEFPVIYDDNIVVPTTDSDGNQFLSLINTYDGETKWKWNDIFTESSGGNLNLYSLYKYNNLLTWQVGGRSYCVNLKNGSTEWKLQRNNTFKSKLSGNNNTYYSLGNTDKYPDYSLKLGYKGNLETGEIEEFLEPDFSFEYSIGTRMCDVTEIVPYEIEGVNHLVVVYQELASDTIWNFQSFLGLYNEETNAWVYDRKVMNEPELNGVSLAPPVIYDNKFYANIGHEMVCHDITTGEQIWSREFTQDFMFSGFIIEEDIIIANNENLTLYGLNPDTGYDLWTGKGAGTCSRMSYMNRIVYFVGGGDGDLHAVDISNGETVWRIDAKNLEGSEAMFKTNAVYVIPGQNGDKGKVIALTHMYAYCFEAYQ
jgi:outer membrane protein assembly factor BamB